MQRLIGRRLDRTAPDSVSILSICAGDGRDVIGVLAERDDATRVKATLVELDPRLCALAQDEAAKHGLGGIEVIAADPGVTATYADVGPADLVILVCVFGNISDPDVRTTLAVLPAFCKRGAIVVWSLRQGERDQEALRRRREEAGRPRRNDPDRVARISGWFDAEGFTEVFANRADSAFHVGAHRYDGAPRPLPANERFFRFDAAEDDSAAAGG